MIPFAVFLQYTVLYTDLSDSISSWWSIGTVYLFNLWDLTSDVGLQNKWDSWKHIDSSIYFPPKIQITGFPTDSIPKENYIY